MIAASRSVIRSSYVRAAARIGVSCPPLRRPARLSSAAARFTRSPAEMSFCVESLLPIHSATASALMTSILAVSRKGCGWISEAGNDDVWRLSMDPIPRIFFITKLPTFLVEGSLHAWKELTHICLEIFNLKNKY